MPWKVQPVSTLRAALVLAVRDQGLSVTQAARDFGVSRKTAYKWLARADGQPLQPLWDRPRRPRSCPSQTPPEVTQAILQARRRFGWGPRKLHAYLGGQGLRGLPSARTVANILRRHGAVPAPRPAAEPLRFQRPCPNDLWQCDFKGPLEVARRKVHPFTVLDDHSRYLIALAPCLDVTMASAFAVLWEAFAECGLPQAILCDNAFGTTFAAPKTLSWFEARLIRLGIEPLHGRPYHPQTQGKVERLHGTLERELWPHIRRDCLEQFTADLHAWRCGTYNALRPHEALADQPPARHWQASPRARPRSLPEVGYPEGAVLRKVSGVGDVRWRRYRILAGRGLVGQYVRIEEREHEVALFYAWKQIRTIAVASLQPGTML